MATLRRSVALAKQLVRPASLASSSPSASRWADLVRLPLEQSSRASSSTASAAAPPSVLSTSSTDAAIAGPSSLRGSAVEPALAVGTASATAVHSNDRATTSPASSGEAPSVAASKQQSLETADLNKPQKKKKAASKGAGAEGPGLTASYGRAARFSKKLKSKVHMVRPTFVESTSFLPSEWAQELEVETEHFVRSEAQAAVEKAERRERKKLAALTRPVDQEQLQLEQDEERLKAIRALHAAQAAHRIIDGALMAGRELQELVDEANTWLRTYEKKNQIRIDHIHTINTLRLDLLRYAHDADHLTDESGELVLNAAGKSQPGHFRSLLREDQLLWDRMVEDPGPLSELETYDVAIAYLRNRKILHTSPMKTSKTPSDPAEFTASSDLSPLG